MIPASQRDELGPEAGRRSQHATDDDAAAYHDRARQIRRPTAESRSASAAEAPMRMGRATGSSWAAKASGANSANEMGGRAYKAETSCRSALRTLGRGAPCRPQSPPPPERDRSAQCPAPARRVTRPLPEPRHVRSRSRRPRHREANLCRPPPGPAGLRGSWPPRSLFPRSGRIRPSAAVPEWNMPSRSCSRTTWPTPSAASRSATCSRKAAVFSPAIAIRANAGRSEPAKPAVACSAAEPDGVHGLADACRCRIPAAGAAVAVRAPRKVEHDSAGAGATGIDSEKDLFQFGLIGCGEES